MDGIEIQEIIREHIGKENVPLGCGGIIDIQKGRYSGLKLGWGKDEEFRLKVMFLTPNRAV